MDNQSLVGATTVVGAHSDVGQAEYDSGKSHSPTAKGKQTVPPPAKFGPHTDYLEESGPFFIGIGKGGVIAALQKLDEQLRAVNSFYFDPYCSNYSKCLPKHLGGAKSNPF